MPGFRSLQKLKGHFIGMNAVVIYSITVLLCNIEIAYMYVSVLENFNLYVSLHFYAYYILTFLVVPFQNIFHSKHVFVRYDRVLWLNLHKSTK